MSNYGVSVDSDTGRKSYMRFNSRPGESLTISGSMSFGAGDSRELENAVSRESRERESRERGGRAGGGGVMCFGVLAESECDNPKLCQQLLPIVDSLLGIYNTVYHTNNTNNTIRLSIPFTFHSGVGVIVCFFAYIWFQRYFLSATTFCLITMKIWWSSLLRGMTALAWRRSSAMTSLVCG